VRHIQCSKVSRRLKIRSAMQALRITCYSFCTKTKGNCASTSLTQLESKFKQAFTPGNCVRHYLQCGPIAMHMKGHGKVLLI
jgi:hypothetical protein